MANAAAIQERLLEVKSEIAEKSAQDSAFRASLLSDPASTIESQYGLDSGSLSGFDVKVVVEDPGSLVVLIPPDYSNMELSEEQLDMVAGGSFWGTVGRIGDIVIRTADGVNRENKRRGGGW